ncbi:DsbA family protein [Actinomycetospora sp. NBRC 106378]|uniref:mycothiol-dependent nitroreductase Rv2466c family protein n=1 Tax=Actinomycetospora sp. NBRC 106378 TaxID=3032208 RepID=UPI0024A5321F|nr:DsbA family protein [Actinomycetospora sp. NBRC 106378]GLZ56070.1 DSBA oxidoreductase [Actinomycetospora sp. NBRC 106378]
MPDLEFFFDPLCPFCWVTSRWVVEVQSQRALRVEWRPLSLALLDEKLPDEQPERSDARLRGLEMLRVVHAAREAHGSEVVGDLYTALGELVWDAEPVEGTVEAVVHEMARERDLTPALRECGLPVSLAEAASDTTRDAALRDETFEAVDRCGGGVGTPILSFDGKTALVGPVIDEPPAEEDAEDLYDAVDKLGRWPGFAELRRSARSFPVTRLSANLARTDTWVR